MEFAAVLQFVSGVLCMLFIGLVFSVIYGVRQARKQEAIDKLERERDHEIRLMDALTKRANHDYLVAKHGDEMVVKRYDSHVRAASLSMQREKANLPPLRGATAAAEASILTAAPNWAPEVVPFAGAVSPDAIPTGEVSVIKADREVSTWLSDNAKLVIGCFDQSDWYIATIVLSGRQAEKYGVRLNYGSGHINARSNADLLDRIAPDAAVYFQGILDGVITPSQASPEVFSY